MLMNVPEGFYNCQDMIGGSGVPLTGYNGYGAGYGNTRLLQGKAPIDAYVGGKPKNETGLMVTMGLITAAVVGAVLCKGKNLGKIFSKVKKPPFRAPVNPQKAEEVVEEVIKPKNIRRVNKEAFMSRLARRRAAKAAQAQPVTGENDVYVKMSVTHNKKVNKKALLSRIEARQKSKAAKQAQKLAEEQRSREVADFYARPKTKGKIKEHHEWEYTAEKLRLEKEAAAKAQAAQHSAETHSFYGRQKTKGKVKAHHEWEYTAEKLKLEKQAEAAQQAASSTKGSPINIKDLIYDGSRPLRMPKALEEAKAKADRILNQMNAKEQNIAKIKKQSERFHAMQDVNQL